MHTNIMTSNTGQLKSGTTRDAITSIAIATPIFNISQNMKPTAKLIADPALRDIPRAIKAPGNTTAIAP